MVEFILFFINYCLKIVYDFYSALFLSTDNFLARCLHYILLKQDPHSSQGQKGGNA